MEMNAYSNKLNQIKTTIENIKGDIEQMKFKNQETLSSLNSTPIQTQALTPPSQKPLTPRPYSLYSKAPLLPMPIAITQGKDSQLAKQQKELINLKATIADLQAKNERLTQDIAEERRKLQGMTRTKGNSQGGKEVLLSIQSLLEVNSLNEARIALNYFIKSNKEQRLKKEFVEKLKVVYRDLSGIGAFEQIDIKMLWRWIKNLIDMVRHLSSQSNEQISNDNAYQEYCTQLMNQYNLKGIEELKSFLSSCIRQSTIYSPSSIPNHVSPHRPPYY